MSPWFCPEPLLFCFACHTSLVCLPLHCSVYSARLSTTSFIYLPLHSSVNHFARRIYYFAHLSTTSLVCPTSLVAALTPTLPAPHGVPVVDAPHARPPALALAPYRLRAAVVWQFTNHLMVQAAGRGVWHLLIQSIKKWTDSKRNSKECRLFGLNGIAWDLSLCMTLFSTGHTHTDHGLGPPIPYSIILLT